MIGERDGKPFGRIACPEFGNESGSAIVPMSPRRYRRAVPWRYTSVEVDTWIPLGTQGAVKDALRGNWETTVGRRTGVTPPTPPPGDGPDPDACTYEILLKKFEG